MLTRWIRNNVPQSAVVFSFVTLLCFLAEADAAMAMTRVVPGLYMSIQDAINHSVDGDTILLNPGRFTGPGNRNIRVDGRSLVITSRAGAEQTIIDCQGVARAFDFSAEYLTGGRVEKITIQNGYAVGSGLQGMGGGIVCSGATIAISQCTILNCRATVGGGINVGAFGGTIEGCVIAGNLADDRGGGIEIDNSGPLTVTSCAITGNRAHNSGGGISFANGTTNRVRDCTITRNWADRFGGGVACSHWTYVERSILWGNCAPVGHELRSGIDGATFACSDVDSTGLYVDPPYGSFVYDEDCLFVDPMFCAPVDCGQTSQGDWTLDGSSPCLPEHSPCSELIGALEQGCGTSPPRGACCRPNGSCVVETPEQCSAEGGRYMGDSSSCSPDPCSPTSDVTIKGQVATWGRIKMTVGGVR